MPNPLEGVDTSNAPYVIVSSDTHAGLKVEEYRDYHRKDGLIVKERDDIMSATRIGVMARRFGRPVLLGSKKPPAYSGGEPTRMAAHAELSGDDLF